MSESNRASRQPTTGRARRIGLAVVVLALVWLLAGIRTIDDHEFGVLDGPLLFGSQRIVEGSWAVAPAPLR